MKKILSVITIFALAMCSIAGCAAKTEEKDFESEIVTNAEESSLETEQNNEPVAQIANPWQDFDNLEDALACAGVNFVMPESLLNEGYEIVYRANNTEGMLEIIFLMNGNEEFRLRAKSEEEISDISGDLNEYEFVDTSVINEFEINVSSNDINTVSVINFYCNNTTYSFTANEMDKMPALDVVEQVINNNTHVY